MLIEEHSPREREVPLNEMVPVDRDAASAMWNAYWRAHADQVGLDDVPTVERFGDHAELSGCAARTRHLGSEAGDGHAREGVRRGRRAPPPRREPLDRLRFERGASG